MNKAVFPGTQGGPLMHVIAGKAVAFAEALKPEFTTYCEQVIDNAQGMAEALLERGHTLVTGGTDNHLLLIDFGELCSGKEAEEALGRAGITTNKNTVPGEKRSPFVTSGVRVGTPAMTTRGCDRNDSVQVGQWIADAIDARDDADALGRIRSQVREMCDRRPIYADLQAS
jgi:glycine hydroxymethyltransferase